MDLFLELVNRFGLYRDCIEGLGYIGASIVGGLYSGGNICSLNLPDSRLFELIEQFGVYRDCIEGLGDVSASMDSPGRIFLHRGCRRYIYTLDSTGGMCACQL